MKAPLLLLLAALSACSIEVPETSAWNHRSHYGLVERTGVEVVELDSPAGADITTVDLSVHGRAGLLAIELTDPEGRVRYRETLRGGSRESELHFAPLEGPWRCRFEFESFSGDYRVHLGARSEPPLRIHGKITGVELR